MTAVTIESCPSFPKSMPATAVLVVMKKISKIKLGLRAESIRNLASRDLAVAQGGLPNPTVSGCASDCDTFKCGGTAPCPTTHHVNC